MPVYYWLSYPGRWAGHSVWAGARTLPGGRIVGRRERVSHFFRNELSRSHSAGGRDRPESWAGCSRTRILLVITSHKPSKLKETK